MSREWEELKYSMSIMLLRNYIFKYKCHKLAIKLLFAVDFYIYIFLYLMIISNHSLKSIVFEKETKISDSLGINYSIIWLSLNCKKKRFLVQINKFWNNEFQYETYWNAATKTDLYKFIDLFAI